MFLTEYLEKFSCIIDDYSKTGYIFSSELNIDIRAENIGLIKASITFTNESRLFATEYLDLTSKTEKLSYSYHYQDKNGRLVFRYDNAVHKPSLGFEHHKHVGDSVLHCKLPDLNGILDEIISELMEHTGYISQGQKGAKPWP
jgi:hypothetical protein